MVSKILDRQYHQNGIFTLWIILSVSGNLSFTKIHSFIVFSSLSKRAYKKRGEDYNYRFGIVLTENRIVRAKFVYK